VARREQPPHPARRGTVLEVGEPADGVHRDHRVRVAREPPEDRQARPPVIRGEGEQVAPHVEVAVGRELGGGLEGLGRADPPGDAHRLTPGGHLGVHGQVADTDKHELELVGIGGRTAGTIGQRAPRLVQDRHRNLAGAQCSPPGPARREPRRGSRGPRPVRRLTAPRDGR
jgi:hypothetical protein